MVNARINLLKTVEVRWLTLGLTYLRLTFVFSI